MEFITKLLNLDFTGLVPNISSVLTVIHIVLTAAVLLGPIALMIMGVLYFFFSPREANYKFGYRTFFGMGSVDAWQLTQKVAGVVFAALGLVLAGLSVYVVVHFRGKDAFQMAETGFFTLLIQFASVVLARVGISLWAALCFRIDGTRRSEKGEISEELEDFDEFAETEETFPEETEEPEEVEEIPENTEDVPEEEPQKEEFVFDVITNL